MSTALVLSPPTLFFFQSWKSDHPRQSFGYVLSLHFLLPFFFQSPLSGFFFLSFFMTISLWILEVIDGPRFRHECLDFFLVSSFFFFFFPFFFGRRPPHDFSATLLNFFLDSFLRRRGKIFLTPPCFFFFIPPFFFFPNRRKMHYLFIPLPKAREVLFSPLSLFFYFPASFETVRLAFPGRCHF